MAKYIFGTLLLLTAFLATSAEDIELSSNATARGAKALSVFQVVRFPNTLCSGSSSLNGTCYTSSECTNKGGTSAGSCASGFGVCCTFTLGCGSTISENTTYFQSATTVTSGQCGVTICECSTDICMLRLDFATFVLTGPSTLTATVISTLNGGSGLGATVKQNFATQCQTDTFTVTGNGGGSPPTLCGTNSGYHMLVDSSNSCNMLNFQMGNTAIGTTLATRSWNIKITQISCFDPNLPPAGCTQYFTGTSGTLNSFNYANGVQLAYQQQTICMRRERSYCRVCYSPTAATDFQISSNTVIAKGYYAYTACCGYGPTGAGTKGYDCVIIPGAVKTASPYTGVANQFCGGKGFGTAAAAGTVIAITVCSYTVPFQFQFVTDGYTMTSSATLVHWKKGFKVAYWETAC